MHIRLRRCPGDTSGLKARAGMPLTGDALPRGVVAGDSPVEGSFVARIADHSRDGPAGFKPPTVVEGWDFSA